MKRCAVPLSFVPILLFSSFIVIFSDFVAVLFSPSNHCHFNEQMKSHAILKRIKCQYVFNLVKPISVPEKSAKPQLNHHKTNIEPIIHRHRHNRQLLTTGIAPRISLADHCDVDRGRDSTGEVTRRIFSIARHNRSSHLIAIFCVFYPAAISFSLMPWLNMIFFRKSFIFGQKLPTCRCYLIIIGSEIYHGLYESTREKNGFLQSIWLLIH